MRHARTAEDLRRWERLCLNQAGECVVPEAAIGLRLLAGNYRAEAEAIERAALPYASQVVKSGSCLALRYWNIIINFLIDLFPAITWPWSPAWCSLPCARCLR
jgi:hypothetical protein